MPTELGNRRAGVGVIVLDNDDDWTLKLSPIGAPIWPEGTTAWIRFYDELGTTLLQFDGIYSEDYLTFSMQHDGTPKPADLPDTGCLFKIRVSLPGDPTTEATLWRGGMEKDL
ncbi:hypothetical protein PBI_MORRISSEY_27 [Gordonia phage Morrissey]|nr:hypothetical protein PBI_MORRISSEY_27 [Gordonia phage Morrissey]